MKRLMLKILLVLGVLIGLFLAGIYIIGQSYQEEIGDLLEQEINQQIKTQVEITECGFDVFSDLPDVAISLNNVLVHSSFKPNKNSAADTLFFAKRILFSFDLFHLLKGSYNLNRVLVENGACNMKVNKKGQDNFQIIKSSSSEDSSAFQLNIKNVILRKMRYYYQNDKQKNKINVWTKKAVVSGNFSNQDFKILTEGEFILKQLKISNINYLKQYDAPVNIKAIIDNKSVRVQKGHLRLANQPLDIQGSYTFDKRSWLDILIHSNRINLEAIKSSLPPNYAQSFEDYEAQGILGLQMQIKGRIAPNSSPNVNIKGELNDAIITNTEKDIDLKFKQLKWDYKSKQASIIIPKIEANILNTTLEGSLKIPNIRRATVLGNIKASGDLKQLNYFHTVDSLFKLEGLFKMQGRFSIPLNQDFQANTQVINQWKTTGDIELQNASVTFKTLNEQNISNLNLKCRLNNQKWEIASLKGTHSYCSNIVFKGTLYSVLPYFFSDNKHFNINGDCHLEQLNINDFMSEESSEETPNKDKALISFFPERMGARIQTHIDRLSFNRFKAQNIKTELLIKPNIIQCSHLSFKNSEGTVNGQLTLQHQQNTYLLKTQGNINNIEIQQLMYQLDNFEQDNITDQHIKGRLQAVYNWRSKFSPDFTLLSPSIKAQFNIRLSEGSLTHYKPLYSLSKFIELEELKTISFENIENELKIDNNTLYVPQMSVYSSAIDFKISGQHHFEGDFKYQINVLLSEVLGRKARERKLENQEFSHIEDDGRGRTSLFLVMQGNSDDFQIKYDTKGVKQHIKEEFKKEKTNLKKILNKEFGWFKKDSAVVQSKKKAPPKKTTKEQFKIEWDD